MSEGDGAERNKKWMDGEYHSYRYIIKDGKMEIYIDGEKLNE